MHNPAQRLGCAKNGASAVKEHPWFSDFDWDAFSRKAMPAPYVPKVRLASSWCLEPSTLNPVEEEMEAPCRPPKC